MWTTIYVAAGKEVSQNIVDQLTREGFMVKSSFLINENGVELYEILAPEFEAEEIQLCMIDIGIM